VPHLPRQQRVRVVERGGGGSGQRTCSEPKQESKASINTLPDRHAHWEGNGQTSIGVSGRANTPSWVLRRLPGRLWNTTSCLTAAPLTHTLWHAPTSATSRCVLCDMWPSAAPSLCCSCSSSSLRRCSCTKRQITSALVRNALYASHLNVTQRALSVTQRELLASPSELLVSPSELLASPSELLACHPASS
jgi:hypothetical protein